MLIAQKPNTEPFGFEIKREIEYCRNHRFWSTDKMKIIPVGHCAICEKEIVPYSTVYFQKHNDNGVRYCFRFDAAHFYCEECAKKESQKEYGIFLPRETGRFTSCRDNQLVVTREYEDGSLLADMTSREKPRF